eukprot:TRINITY_DN11508_c0_g1_i1.p2 TRINITY_DN11508_c0_g1~~TRINITY_DN11508_c0_g1_i1.p2  ORF type:complete len:102 (-),score=20.99 TRINITY_DN11508_c0_g1_i1:472-732(-)
MRVEQEQSLLNLLSGCLFGFTGRVVGVLLVTPLIGMTSIDTMPKNWAVHKILRGLFGLSSCSLSLSFGFKQLLEWKLRFLVPLVSF